MNHTFLEFGMCQRLFLDSHGNLPCSESTNPESFGEPLSWMQGDAMDAWCATCCEENRVMKPAERKKCHGTAFVPSTALQFLTSSVDDRHDLFISSVCNAIANATPRGHFQKDSSSTRSIYIPDVIEYVMLPFCTGSHWQLLYFNQRQARVVFYDPLSTLHEPSHVMKVFGDAIRLFGAEDWEIEIRRGNQKNGVDCGYHVSTLMYTLWRGDVAEEVAHQEIQDEHMNEVYRRAFAMDIVRGIWRVYNISYLQVYWAARSDARGSTHLNLILAAIKNPNQAMSSQSQAQAPQISATEFSSQVAVTVS